MQYLKKNSGKLLAIVCLLAVLAGCWRLGRLHDGRQTAPVQPSLSDSGFDGALSYLAPTGADRNADSGNAARLALEDMEQAVITAGGDYLLTGELDETLYIRAEDQNVHLILDGVSIRSRKGPAIWVESAGKVFITLASDSENYLNDSADYRHLENAEACITANCNLSFNGSGSLRIVGSYRDAIRTSDVLRILDGSYTVLCKRNGLYGTDGILVNGGTIEISSEKNGLRTAKSGVDGKGALAICGGSLNIIAGRYSFVCSRGDLYIYDCTVREKSVVGVASVGGSSYIQEGCVS